MGRALPADPCIRVDHGHISTLALDHALGAEPKSFASPEDAVKALVEALRVNDTKALSDLFGPGSKDLVSSGDPVADQGRRKQFVHFYELKTQAG